MPRIVPRSTCAWLERRICAPSLMPRMRRSSAASCGSVGEVDLVDDDPVGGDDLVDRLVVEAVQRRIVEVALDVHRVDQGDDAVELDLARDLVVDEERGRDRRRVGQAAGLDQDVVELVAALEQLLQDADEIGAHVGDAADAAVRHLEDLFVGRQHEVRVDVDLAELVLDHRDAVAVALGQDVVQQGRLAGAEEAGEDRHRHRSRGRRGFGFGRCRSLVRGGLARFAAAFSRSACSTCSGRIG